MAKSEVSYACDPRELLAYVCENSLYTFVKRMWSSIESSTYIDNWHIQAICDHLEAVTSGEIPRLLINIPPGCSKSLLVGVFWPMWEWARDASIRWFFASYDQRLSTRDSVKCKVLLNSDLYQHLYGDRYNLVQGRDEKTYYETSEGGYRLATSVGGHGTGQHPDRVVCFPEDELVWTTKGKLPIGDIVNRRMRVEVLSYNTSTNNMEVKPIIGWHKNPGRELVEVVFDNGSSIRCTADHRVWTTKRGWVEAGQLLTSDVLPCFSVPDVVDGINVNSKSLSENSSQFVGSEDVPNVQFAELAITHTASSLAVVAEADAFCDFSPRLPSSDLRYGSCFDSVPFGENVSRFHAFSDSYGLLSSEDSPRTPFENRESSVSFGIVDVLRSRAVTKVGEVVIHGVPVEVSDFHSFGTETYECSQDLLMNVQIGNHTVLRCTESRVASAGRAFEDLAYYGVGHPTSNHCTSSDSSPTEARHAVQPLKVNHCSPTLIRHWGFAHATYCLTVKDNHTFMVGDHDSIIVANCDDPHNVRQAESEVERQSVLDWWDFTMSTRGVSRNARRVIIMQRLHERDLSAHVINRGDWVHVCLCMRHEYGRMSETPLGWNDPRTEEGELLSSQQFTEAAVTQMELNLGAYGTAGQLQQRPQPKGGGMFKCLSSGTLIETVAGSKPIEDVSVGDLVLTRSGPKRVLTSMQTGEANKLISVLFSNGSLVIGSAEHLVLIQSKGYTRLDSLSGDDQAVLLTDWREPWNRSVIGCVESKGSIGAVADATSPSESDHITEIEAYRSTDKGITPEWQRQKSFITTVSVSPETEEVDTSTAVMADCHYTERCGSFTMGVFPLGMTFITRTETGIITTSRILNASAGRIIPSIIEHWTTRPESRQTSGIDQKKDGRSIGSVPTVYGRLNRIDVASALDADVSTRQDHLLELLGSFVRRVVERSNVGKNGIKLYDLEVEDSHEFFANGILVHNCNWFSQRVRSAPYNCKRIRMWDRASTSDGGCFTAGVLMGRAQDGHFYIEDVVKGQWEPNERNQIMRATALKDRMKYGPNHEPVIYVEAEGGSSGKDAWKSVVRALAGFNVREDRPTGSKDVRAEPWASELSAMNVYLVDNGESEGSGKATWDINAFIYEHVVFRPEPGKRLGKYKDQVDSASAAYNLFVGTKQVQALRIYSLGTGKRVKGLRVIVCSHDELANLVDNEARCLLVSLKEPSPIGDTSMPMHGLNKLDGHLTLQFTSIDPADTQDNWHDIVPEYNKLPEDLIMKREHGKSLWAFLLKKRDPIPDCYVIADDDNGKAMSLALSVVDTLRLDRDSTICNLAESDNKVGTRPPPIKHVYEMVKASRGMVVA